MAAFVLTDAKITVNSVNLSDHVTQATLNINAETQDSTAMGATYHARLGGLKDATLDLVFNQDYASSNVDSTLFALIGTSTALTIKPTSGNTTATNPEYQFTGILTDYQPFGQSVGDKASASAKFVIASGNVTRAVA